MKERRFLKPPDSAIRTEKWTFLHVYMEFET